MWVVSIGALLLVLGLLNTFAPFALVFAAPLAVVAAAASGISRFPLWPSSTIGMAAVALLVTALLTLLALFVWLEATGGLH